MLSWWNELSIPIKSLISLLLHSWGNAIRGSWYCFIKRFTVLLRSINISSCCLLYSSFDSMSYLWKFVYCRQESFTIRYQQRTIRVKIVWCRANVRNIHTARKQLRYSKINGFIVYIVEDKLYFRCFTLF